MQAGPLRLDLDGLAGLAAITPLLARCSSGGVVAVPWACGLSIAGKALMLGLHAEQEAVADRKSTSPPVG